MATGSRENDKFNENLQWTGPDPCDGLLIDNSFPGRLEIYHSQGPLLVHQVDGFCRVHECTCGNACDDADEAEEMTWDHMDGRPYDPWSGHEFECGARLVVPHAMSLTCGCDDHSEDDDEPNDMPAGKARRAPSLKRMREALIDNDLEAVGKPLRELVPDVRDKTVARLVQDHRERHAIASREAPNVFAPGVEAARFGWNKRTFLIRIARGRRSWIRGGRYRLVSFPAVSRTSKSGAEP